MTGPMAGARAVPRAGGAPALRLPAAAWLLLIDPPAPGAWNMALDDALLDSADRDGTAALRLYGWDPHTLSFGRHEPALRRYDRAAIEARNLATVRRPTGGRAVWHAREVTYSVAAPVAAFGSLRESYAEIHATLAEALNALGAAVVLAPDRPADGVGAGACFASAAGGEVLALGGAKMVGSAQVRQGRAFLQHGSILLHADQGVVAGVTRGAVEAPAATGLAEQIGAAAAFAAVADAIARTAAVRWGTPATPAPPPEALRQAAAARRAHYEDPAWTWRR